MGKNLLQIDIGLCLAYPEVLISALIGLNAEMNPNETILLTAEQASWLGVLRYLNSCNVKKIIEIIWYYHCNIRNT